MAKDASGDQSRFGKQPLLIGQWFILRALQSLQIFSNRLALVEPGKAILETWPLENLNMTKWRVTWCYIKPKLFLANIHLLFVKNKVCVFSKWPSELGLHPKWKALSKLKNLTLAIKHGITEYEQERFANSSSKKNSQHRRDSVTAHNEVYV